MTKRIKSLQLVLAVAGVVLFVLGATADRPISTLLGGCVGLCVIAIIGVRDLP